MDVALGVGAQIDGGVREERKNDEGSAVGGPSLQLNAGLGVGESGILVAVGPVFRFGTDFTEHKMSSFSQAGARLSLVGLLGGGSQVVLASEIGRRWEDLPKSSNLYTAFEVGVGFGAVPIGPVVGVSFDPAKPASEAVITEGPTVYAGVKIGL